MKELLFRCQFCLDEQPREDGDIGMSCCGAEMQMIERDPAGKEFIDEQGLFTPVRNEYLERSFGQ